MVTEIKQGKKIRINKKITGLDNTKWYVVKDVLFPNDNNATIHIKSFPYGISLHENEYDLEMPNAEFSKGDKVLILNKTNSFEANQEVTIMDFMCDDPNRIIAEGVSPGGWISSYNVYKKINIDGLRFKNIYDMMFEFGLSIIINLPDYMFNMLGKPLKDFKIWQIGKSLMVNNPKGTASKIDISYTEDGERTVIRNLKLCMANREYIAVNVGTSHAPTLALADKFLSDFSTWEDDVDKLSDLITRFKKVSSGFTITDSGGKVIHLNREMLLVKDANVKKEVEDKLPF